MIEEITCYTFIYTPWDSTFPIRSCHLVIYAKSRKEAELIAMDNGWKFFDQSCTVSVVASAHGYRQVIEEDNK